MNTCSTVRVQRYRQRQREAGRKRLTLYIDAKTQRKLDQLADGKAQASLVEELLQAAINQAWIARMTPLPDDLQANLSMKAATDEQMSVAADLMRSLGRRRNQAGGLA